MAAKKRPVTQEPLLNAVARKLGHAAGTLSKVTLELTENLSTLPGTVTRKVRKAAQIGTKAKRSGPHIHHPGKRTSKTARTQKPKASTGRKRSRPKTRRRSPSPTTVKR